MKQAFRNRFGLGYHEGQRQGQAKEKFMESSMGERYSSPFAYFEKQLSVSVTGIKPSYHDLELLYDNILFDLLVTNFSSSCASMWSKIHNLLESFIESGYDERISWFSWSLSDVFHAKIKGEFVENCDYESAFLYASIKPLELKFLELYVPYVTLVGNVMVNPFTCDLALDVDHMFSAVLNSFVDILVANFSSSCAYMRIKINIFFGSFVESSYDKRISWFSWSLCDVLHAKVKRKFVENCNYVSSFLYDSMKDFDGFTPSIKLLCFVSDQFEFPHDEQKVLIVDEFLKALLLENNNGFQFYHFHFKEFTWLIFCEKKMNGSFEVLKVHLCDFVKTIFGNGVPELTLKKLDEKYLVYSIAFIDFER
ncbi:hypothetical protein M9H77_22358 [Catharanthus roseus]|uniref:Uncharacterized protein n=1 Tax=Catharanthus roseus TaxID=4058 RepID=A0ACC0ARZ9_CATRO|nr:hypothetical protein M9H77_22358 [Catharanthus roseus]